MSRASAVTGSKPAWRQEVALAGGLGFAILAFAAALTTLMWFVVIHLVALDHAKTVQTAIERNDNLSFVFEQYVLRTLESADFITKSLAREYQRSGEKIDLGRFASTYITDNKSIVGVVLADQHGIALTTAYTGKLTRGTNIADREHFSVHVREDSGELFVGKPVIGRVSGRPVIPLSRRINNPDGSFGGVAVALIEPDRFIDVLRDAKLRPLDVVSLVGFDGITRARLSGNRASWGENISQSPLFALRVVRPVGNYVAAGQRDQVSRYYSYRAVPGYQVLATVGAAESDVLVDFKRRREDYYGGAGLVSLFIVVFTMLLVLSLAARRRAERERQASDNQFRTIFDEAGIGMALVSADDGRFINGNRALANMLGYSVEELRALSVRDVSDPEDYVKDKKQWPDLVAGRIQRFRMEKKYYRRDGTPLWGVLTSTLVRRNDAAPQYFIRMIEDVSDIKKARDEVRRLGDRLALTMENITDVFITLDREWRFTFLNKAAERLMGRTRDNLLGRILWEEFPEAVGTVFDRQYHVAMETMTMTECAAYSAPLEAWIEARAYPSQEGLALYIRDVSVAKQAELAAARMHAIVESSNDAIVSTDLEGVITSWNAGAERIFGHAGRDIIGRPISILLPPEFVGEERDMRVRVATGERVEHFETARTGKGGRRIDVSVTVSPLRDASGAIIGASEVVRDITVRKQAEQAMQDYSERLQRLSRRLMQVEEDERRRLGRDLHDRTGSNLSALLMSQELLRRNIPEAAMAQTGPLLDDAEALLRETIQHVREVLTELRPPALEELGLLAALRHHAQLLSRSSGLAVDVEGAEVSPRLPAGVEISLFRIAQEALNNAIKHAQATRIVVELRSEAWRVSLSIADNGKGFDRNESQTGGGGLGMLTMRERAQAVGGDLIIHSSAQAGTQVLIEFALEPLH